MKILLLEDDPDISFIYKRQFEKSEHPTDAFFTGKEALDALTRNTYDISLIDVMLPDTNGIEVVKHIRQNSTLDAMTTIVLSNMGEESIVDEAKKIGADGYLIKSSMNPSQLIDQVMNIHTAKHTPKQ